MIGKIDVKKREKRGGGDTIGETLKEIYGKVNKVKVRKTKQL